MHHAAAKHRSSAMPGWAVFRRRRLGYSAAVATCPKCSSQNLSQVPQTALIGLGPAPLRCGACAGIWLLPETVQNLRTAGLLEALDSPNTSRREEDQRTGICPEGHGIMTRARVALDDPYFLERCSRCHGIWFDAGEWNRLATDQLLEHLDDLWSPSWRRKLMQAESEQQLATDLELAFGPDLHAKLDELASALSGRSDAGMALAYLRERILSGRRKKPG